MSTDANTDLPFASWDPDPVYTLGNAWITFGDAIYSHANTMNNSVSSVGMYGTWQSAGGTIAADTMSVLTSQMQTLAEQCWHTGEAINYYGLLRTQQEDAANKQSLAMILAEIFGLIFGLALGFLGEIAALIDAGIAALSAIGGILGRLGTAIAAALETAGSWASGVAEFVGASSAVTSLAQSAPWVLTAAEVTADIAGFAAGYSAVNALSIVVGDSIAGVKIDPASLSPIPTTPEGWAMLAAMAVPVIGLSGARALKGDGAGADAEPVESVTADGAVTVPKFDVAPRTVTTTEPGAGAGSQVPRVVPGSGTDVLSVPSAGGKIPDGSGGKIPGGVVPDKGVVTDTSGIRPAPEGDPGAKVDPTPSADTTIGSSSAVDDKFSSSNVLISRPGTVGEPGPAFGGGRGEPADPVPAKPPTPVPDRGTGTRLDADPNVTNPPTNVRTTNGTPAPIKPVSPEGVPQGRPTGPDGQPGPGNVVRGNGAGDVKPSGVDGQPVPGNVVRDDGSGVVKPTGPDGQPGPGNVVQGNGSGDVKPTGIDGQPGPGNTVGDDSSSVVKPAGPDGQPGPGNVVRGNGAGDVKPSGVDGQPVPGNVVRDNGSGVITPKPGTNNSSGSIGSSTGSSVKTTSADDAAYASASTNGDASANAGAGGARSGDVGGDVPGNGAKAAEPPTPVHADGSGDRSADTGPAGSAKTPDPAASTGAATGARPAAEPAPAGADAGPGAATGAKPALVHEDEGGSAPPAASASASAAAQGADKVVVPRDTGPAARDSQDPNESAASSANHGTDVVTSSRTADNAPDHTPASATADSGAGAKPGAPRDGHDPATDVGEAGNPAARAADLRVQAQTAALRADDARAASAAHTAKTDLEKADEQLADAEGRAGRLDDASAAVGRADAEVKAAASEHTAAQDAVSAARARQTALRTALGKEKATLAALQKQMKRPVGGGRTHAYVQRAKSLARMDKLTAALDNATTRVDRAAARADSAYRTTLAKIDDARLARDERAAAESDVRTAAGIKPPTRNEAKAAADARAAEDTVAYRSLAQTHADAVAARTEGLAHDAAGAHATAVRDANAAKARIGEAQAALDKALTDPARSLQADLARANADLARANADVAHATADLARFVRVAAAKVHTDEVLPRTPHDVRAEPGDGGAAGSAGAAGGDPRTTVVTTRPEVAPDVRDRITADVLSAGKEAVSAARTSEAVAARDVVKAEATAGAPRRALAEASAKDVPALTKAVERTAADLARAERAAAAAREARVLTESLDRAALDYARAVRNAESVDRVGVARIADAQAKGVGRDVGAAIRAEIDTGTPAAADAAVARDAAAVGDLVKEVDAAGKAADDAVAAAKTRLDAAEKAVDDAVRAADGKVDAAQAKVDAAQAEVDAAQAKVDAQHALDVRTSVVMRNRAVALDRAVDEYNRAATAAQTARADALAKVAAADEAKALRAQADDGLALDGRPPAGAGLSGHTSLVDLADGSASATRLAPGARDLARGDAGVRAAVQAYDEATAKTAAGAAKVLKTRDLAAVEPRVEGAAEAAQAAGEDLSGALADEAAKARAVDQAMAEVRAAEAESGHAEVKNLADAEVARHEADAEDAAKTIEQASAGQPKAEAGAETGPRGQTPAGGGRSGNTVTPAGPGRAGTDAPKGPGASSGTAGSRGSGPRPAAPGGRTAPGGARPRPAGTPAGTRGGGAIDAARGPGAGIQHADLGSDLGSNLGPGHGFGVDEKSPFGPAPDYRDPLSDTSSRDVKNPADFLDRPADVREVSGDDGTVTVHATAAAPSVEVVAAPHAWSDLGAFADSPAGIRTELDPEIRDLVDYLMAGLAKADGGAAKALPSFELKTVRPVDDAAYRDVAPAYSADDRPPAYDDRPPAYGEPAAGAVDFTDKTPQRGDLLSAEQVQSLAQRLQAQVDRAFEQALADPRLPGNLHGDQAEPRPSAQTDRPSPPEWEQTAADGPRTGPPSNAGAAEQAPARAQKIMLGSMQKYIQQVDDLTDGISHGSGGVYKPEGGDSAPGSTTGRLTEITQKRDGIVQERRTLLTERANLTAPPADGATRAPDAAAIARITTKLDELNDEEAAATRQINRYFSHGPSSAESVTMAPKPAAAAPPSAGPQRIETRADVEAALARITDQRRDLLTERTAAGPAPTVGTGLGRDLTADLRVLDQREATVLQAAKQVDLALKVQELNRIGENLPRILAERNAAAISFDNAHAQWAAQRANARAETAEIVARKPADELQQAKTEPAAAGHGSGPAAETAPATAPGTTTRGADGPDTVDPATRMPSALAVNQALWNSWRPFQIADRQWTSALQTAQADLRDLQQPETRALPSWALVSGTAGPIAAGPITTDPAAAQAAPAQSVPTVDPKQGSDTAPEQPETVAPTVATAHEPQTSTTTTTTTTTTQPMTSTPAPATPAEPAPQPPDPIPTPQANTGSPWGRSKAPNPKRADPAPAAAPGPPGPPSPAALQAATAWGRRLDGVIGLVQFDQLPEEPLADVRTEIVQAVQEFDDVRTGNPLGTDDVRGQVDSRLTGSWLMEKLPYLRDLDGLSFSVHRNGRRYEVALRLTLVDPVLARDLPDFDPTADPKADPSAAADRVMLKQEERVTGISWSQDGTRLSNYRSLAGFVTKTWQILRNNPVSTVVITPDVTVTQNQMVETSTAGTGVQTTVVMRTRQNSVPLDFTMNWEFKITPAAESVPDRALGAVDRLRDEIPLVNLSTDPAPDTGWQAADTHGEARVMIPDHLAMPQPTTLAPVASLDDIPLYSTDGLRRPARLLTEVNQRYAAEFKNLSDQSRDAVEEFLGEKAVRGSMPLIRADAYVSRPLFDKSGRVLGVLQLSAVVDRITALLPSTSIMMENYLAQTSRLDGTTTMTNGAEVTFPIATTLSADPGFGHPKLADYLRGTIMGRIGGGMFKNKTLGSGGTAAVLHSLKSAAPHLQADADVSYTVTLVRPGRADKVEALGRWANGLVLRVQSQATADGVPAATLTTKAPGYLSTPTPTVPARRYAPSEINRLDYVGMSATADKITGTAPLFAAAETWLTEHGYLPRNTQSTGEFDALMQRRYAAQLENYRRLKLARSPLGLRTTVDEAVDGGSSTWFDLPGRVGDERVELRLTAATGGQAGYLKTVENVQIINFSNTTLPGSASRGDSLVGLFEVAARIAGPLSAHPDETSPTGAVTFPDYTYQRETDTTKTASNGLQHEQALLSASAQRMDVFDVPLRFQLDLHKDDGERPTESFGRLVNSPDNPALGRPWVAGRMDLWLPEQRTGATPFTGTPGPATVRRVDTTADEQQALNPATAMPVPATAVIDALGGTADVKKVFRDILAGRYDQGATPPAAAAASAVPTVAPTGAARVSGPVTRLWKATTETWLWRKTFGENPTHPAAMVQQMGRVGLSPTRLIANSNQVLSGTYAVEHLTVPGLLADGDVSFELRAVPHNPRLVANPVFGGDGTQMDLAGGFPAYTETDAYGPDGTSVAATRSTTHQLSGIAASTFHLNPTTGLDATPTGGYGKTWHDSHTTVDGTNSQVNRVDSEDDVMFRFKADLTYVLTVRRGRRSLPVNSSTLKHPLGNWGVREDVTVRIDVPDGFQAVLTGHQVREHQAGLGTAAAAIAPARLPALGTVPMALPERFRAGDGFGLASVTDVVPAGGRDDFLTQITDLVDSTTPGALTPGHQAYWPGLRSRLADYASPLGMRVLAGRGVGGTQVVPFVYVHSGGSQLVEIELTAEPTGGLAALNGVNGYTLNLSQSERDQRAAAASPAAGPPVPAMPGSDNGVENYATTSGGIVGERHSVSTSHTFLFNPSANHPENVAYSVNDSTGLTGRLVFEKGQESDKLLTVDDRTAVRVSSATEFDIPYTYSATVRMSKPDKDPVSLLNRVGPGVVNFFYDLLRDAPATTRTSAAGLKVRFATNETPTRQGLPRQVRRVKAAVHLTDPIASPTTAGAGQAVPSLAVSRAVALRKEAAEQDAAQALALARAAAIAAAPPGVAAAAVPIPLVAIDPLTSRGEVAPGIAEYSAPDPQVFTVHADLQVHAFSGFEALQTAVGQVAPKLFPQGARLWTSVENSTIQLAQILRRGTAALGNSRGEFGLVAKLSGDDAVTVKTTLSGLRLLSSGAALIDRMYQSNTTVTAPVHTAVTPSVTLSETIGSNLAVAGGPRIPLLRRTRDAADQIAAQSYIRREIVKNEPNAARKDATHEVVADLTLELTGPRGTRWVTGAVYLRLLDQDVLGHGVTGPNPFPGTFDLSAALGGLSGLWDAVKNGPGAIAPRLARYIGAEVAQVNPPGQGAGPSNGPAPRPAFTGTIHLWHDLRAPLPPGVSAAIAQAAAAAAAAGDAATAAEAAAAAAALTGGQGVTAADALFLASSTAQTLSRPVELALRDEDGVRQILFGADGRLQVDGAGTRDALDTLVDDAGAWAGSTSEVDRITGNLDTLRRTERRNVGPITQAEQDLDTRTTALGSVRTQVDTLQTAFNQQAADLAKLKVKAGARIGELQRTVTDLDRRATLGRTAVEQAEQTLATARTDLADLDDVADLLENEQAVSQIAVGRLTLVVQQAEPGAAKEQAQRALDARKAADARKQDPLREQLRLGNEAVDAAAAAYTARNDDLADVQSRLDAAEEELADQRDTLAKAEKAADVQQRGLDRKKSELSTLATDLKTRGDQLDVRRAQQARVTRDIATDERALITAQAALRDAEQRRAALSDGAAADAVLDAHTDAGLGPRGPVLPAGLTGPALRSPRGATHPYHRSGAPQSAADQAGESASPIGPRLPGPETWGPGYDQAPISYVDTERFDPAAAQPRFETAAEPGAAAARPAGAPGGALAGAMTVIRYGVRRFQTPLGHWVRQYIVDVPVVRRAEVDPASVAALNTALQGLADSAVNGFYRLPRSADQLHLTVNLVDVPRPRDGIVGRDLVDLAGSGAAGSGAGRRAQTDQFSWHLDDDPATLLHEVMHFAGLPDRGLDPSMLFRRFDPETAQRRTGGVPGANAAAAPPKYSGGVGYGSLMGDGTPAVLNDADLAAIENVADASTVIRSRRAGAPVASAPASETRADGLARWDHSKAPEPGDLHVAGWLLSADPQAAMAAASAHATGGEAENVELFRSLWERSPGVWQRLTPSQAAVLVAAEREGLRAARADRQGLAGKIVAGSWPWMDGYASSGMTVDELIGAASGVLGRMDLTINIDLDARAGGGLKRLDQMIGSDTALRNAWEVHRHGPDDVDYLRERGEVETLLGYPGVVERSLAALESGEPGARPWRELPKYAALMSELRPGALGSYGDAVFHLKPEVRFRSTFTPGDSFALTTGLWGLRGAGHLSPLLEYGDERMVRLVFAEATGFAFDPEYRRMRDEGGLSDELEGEYFEAQIHGDLLWQDVDRIVLDNYPADFDLASANKEALEQFAASRGLSFTVEVLNPPTSDSEGSEAGSGDESSDVSMRGGSGNPQDVYTAEELAEFGGSDDGSGVGGDSDGGGTATPRGPAAGSPTGLPAVPPDRWTMLLTPDQRARLDAAGLIPLDLPGARDDVFTAVFTVNPDHVLAQLPGTEDSAGIAAAMRVRAADHVAAHRAAFEAFVARSAPGSDPARVVRGIELDLRGPGPYLGVAGDLTAWMLSGAFGLRVNVIGADAVTAFGGPAEPSVTLVRVSAQPGLSGIGLGAPGHFRTVIPGPARPGAGGETGPGPVPAFAAANAAMSVWRDVSPDRVWALWEKLVLGHPADAAGVLRLGAFADEAETREYLDAMLAARLLEPAGQSPAGTQLYAARMTASTAREGALYNDWAQGLSDPAARAGALRLAPMPLPEQALGALSQAADLDADVARAIWTGLLAGPQDAARTARAVGLLAEEGRPDVATVRRYLRALAHTDSVGTVASGAGPGSPFDQDATLFTARVPASVTSVELARLLAAVGDTADPAARAGGLALLGLPAGLPPLPEAARAQLIRAGADPALARLVWSQLLSADQPVSAEAIGLQVGIGDAGQARALLAVLGQAGLVRTLSWPGSPGRRHVGAIPPGTGPADLDALRDWLGGAALPATVHARLELLDLPPLPADAAALLRLLPGVERPLAAAFWGLLLSSRGLSAVGVQRTARLGGPADTSLLESVTRHLDGLVLAGLATAHTSGGPAPQRRYTAVRPRRLTVLGEAALADWADRAAPAARVGILGRLAPSPLPLPPLPAASTAILRDLGGPGRFAASAQWAWVGLVAATRAQTAADLAPHVALVEPGADPERVQDLLDAMVAAGVATSVGLLGNDHLYAARLPSGLDPDALAPTVEWVLDIRDPDMQTRMLANLGLPAVVPPLAGEAVDLLPGHLLDGYLGYRLNVHDAQRILGTLLAAAGPQSALQIARIHGLGRPAIVRGYVNALIRSGLAEALPTEPATYRAAPLGVLPERARAAMVDWARELPDADARARVLALRALAEPPAPVPLPAVVLRALAADRIDPDLARLVWSGGLRAAHLTAAQLRALADLPDDEAAHEFAAALARAGILGRRPVGSGGGSGGHVYVARFPAAPAPGASGVSAAASAASAAEFEAFEAWTAGIAHPADREQAANRLTPHRRADPLAGPPLLPAAAAAGVESSGSDPDTVREGWGALLRRPEPVSEADIAQFFPQPHPAGDVRPPTARDLADAGLISRLRPGIYLAHAPEALTEDERSALQRWASALPEPDEQIRVMYHLMPQVLPEPVVNRLSSLIHAASGGRLSVPLALMLWGELLRGEGLDSRAIGFLDVLQSVTSIDEDGHELPAAIPASFVVDALVSVGLAHLDPAGAEGNDYTVTALIPESVPPPDAAAVLAWAGRFAPPEVEILTADGWTEVAGLQPVEYLLSNRIELITDFAAAAPTAFDQVRAAAEPSRPETVQAPPPDSSPAAARVGAYPPVANLDDEPAAVGSRRPR